MATNVDDELFWKQVREAYDQVTTNSERVVTLQVGHREVAVFVNHEPEEWIVIHIREAIPKQPTLVVPAN